MIRKLKQHIRRFVEPDPRLSIIRFLKDLVAVPHLTARDDFDTAITRFDNHANTPTDGFLVRCLVHPVEHMWRRDDGFDAVFCCRLAHDDSLFKRYRTVISFRKNVTMYIDHLASHYQ